MIARSNVVTRGAASSSARFSVAAIPIQQQRTQTASRDHAVDVRCGRRAAKIALRKGKADAKKTKIYARMVRVGMILLISLITHLAQRQHVMFVQGKRIITVVKGGGPDPATNASLSALMKQAQQLGVPKDILERNIKKASDAKQSDFTEIFYEAYGPGGTGFIVECLTDNVNRSASDVKSQIGSKGIGKVAEPGSVSFNFTRAGSILVEQTNEDAIFEASMEAGGEDVVPVEDEDGPSTTSFTVFSAADAFGSTLSKLKELGFTVNMETSELVYRANAPVEVSDEDYTKCENLMDRLLELDDVENVYTNCDGLQL